MYHDTSRSGLWDWCAAIEDYMCRNEWVHHCFMGSPCLISPSGGNFGFGWNAPSIYLTVISHDWPPSEPSSSLSETRSQKLKTAS